MNGEKAFLNILWKCFNSTGIVVAMLMYKLLYGHFQNDKPYVKFYQFHYLFLNVRNQSSIILLSGHVFFVDRIYSTVVQNAFTYGNYSVFQYDKHIFTLLIDHPCNFIEKFDIFVSLFYLYGQHTIVWFNLRIAPAKYITLPTKHFFFIFELL